MQTDQCAFYGPDVLGPVGGFRRHQLLIVAWPKNFSHEMCNEMWERLSQNSDSAISKSSVHASRNFLYMYTVYVTSYCYITKNRDVFIFENFWLSEIADKR